MAEIERDFELSGGTLVRYTGVRKHVTVPEGVTRIDAGAFVGRKNLKGVVFPKSLEVVENGAFDGCQKLRKITLLQDLPALECLPTNGRTVFSGYLGDVKMRFHFRYTAGGGGRVYSQRRQFTGLSCPLTVRDGALFSGQTLLHPLGALRGVYTIPDGTQEIGPFAFAGQTDLTRIVFPNTVEKIHYRTFAYCSGLTELNLPGSLWMAGLRAEAFRGCAGLTALHLPDKLKGRIIIPQGAFRDCTALPAVVIPKCVTDIRDGAFQNCTALKDVSLPNGLTALAANAFLGCTALGQVTLPASIRRFSNCEYNLPADSPHYLTMPEGFLRQKGTISNTMFDHFQTYWMDQATEEDWLWMLLLQDGAGFRNLCRERMTPPYDVHVTRMAQMLRSGGRDKQIEKAAAFVRENREQVGPEAVQALYDTAAARGSKRALEMLEPLLDGGNPDDLRLQFDISSGALRRYNGPGGEVTVPDHITALCKGAFQGCETVTGVTLPEGLRTIGKRAFCGCVKLERVTLPQSLTTIGPYAFQNCAALRSIDLPQTLTRLGREAFRDCTSLRRVTVPQGVKVLEYGVFAGTELEEQNPLRKHGTS